MGTRRKTDEEAIEAVHPGLGARVRRAREAAGIGLNEASRASGINHSQLSRFETEQLGMSIPRFMRLLASLELRAGDMLDPDVDEKSRFLQMARKVRSLIGTQNMQWLSELSKLEARLAVEGAKKEVQYHRSEIARAADSPPASLHSIRGEGS